MASALEDLTRHITALGGISTRARDLTLEQAWALVESYGSDGTLPRLSFPKQRDRKAFLNSHQIDTVDYVKVLDFNKDGKITKSSKDPIAAENVGAGLDVRFIVLLVRITRMLRKRFGASQIFHLGFQSAHRDAHGDGRALDFVGAAGTFEGTGYSMNVFSHWKLAASGNAGGVRPAQEGRQAGRLAGDVPRHQLSAGYPEQSAPGGESLVHHGGEGADRGRATVRRGL